MFGDLNNPRVPQRRRFLGMVIGIGIPVVVIVANVMLEAPSDWIAIPMLFLVVFAGLVGPRLIAVPPPDVEATANQIVGEVPIATESAGGGGIAETDRPELAHVTMVLRELLADQHRRGVRLQVVFFLLGAAAGVATQLFMR